MAKLDLVIDYDGWPEVSLKYFIEYPDKGVMIELESEYSGKVVDFSEVDPENIDMRKFMGYKKPYNISINIESNKEDFESMKNDWINEPYSVASIKDAPFDPVFRDMQWWFMKAILGDIYYGKLSGR